MRIILSFFLALLATTVAHAGAKVTALDWQPAGERGRFVVSVAGALSENPEWDVLGGRFALTLPGAKIEKSIVRKEGQVRIAAANTNRGVLATLTFAQGHLNADDIALTLQNGNIEVSATVPKAVATPFTVKSPLENNSKAKVTKESLGEDFLKKIEAEVEQTPELSVAAVAAPTASTAVSLSPTQASAVEGEDEIRSRQAAPGRTGDFSFATYAGKFIAFLGLVLLFFWGVVQLMKKGVLSKSKLGFLNNEQLVTVISTTYVAPKRSLILVKAHQQAFLISSSEAGMHLVSEVRDVPGLVKESERAIAGSNFDDSIEKVERSETVNSETVKFKDNIYQSTPIEEKAGVHKDIVRFSDELKKKVKNLKALQ